MGWKVWKPGTWTRRGSEKFVNSCIDVIIYRDIEEDLLEFKIIEDLGNLSDHRALMVKVKDKELRPPVTDCSVSKPNRKLMKVHSKILLEGLVNARDTGEVWEAF